MNTQDSGVGRADRVKASESLFDARSQRLIYAATNLVARDLWGAHNQVVSYAAWDRGHLDDEVYRMWLRQAVDLVKCEAGDDEYGGTPQALAVLPGLFDEVKIAARKGSQVASVPSHRSDELPRYIQIDRLNFRVDVETLTGRELRDLPTPGLSNDYDLWHVVPACDDEIVRDDDVIDLRGGRFYSMPRIINAG